MIIGFVAGLLPTEQTFAQINLDDAGNLKIYPDFRFRLEQDWNSHRSDGSLRSDRGRARIRVRTKVQYTPTTRLTIGIRIRTGSSGSQQSPHITIYDFNSNPTGDHHLLPDQWFVRVSGTHLWAWAGRNSLPIWKRNEFFWNDNVIPIGLSAGYTYTAGKAQVLVNSGYFLLPDGGVGVNGRLWGGQVVSTIKSELVDVTTASGVWVFNRSPGATHLRNGNDGRGYRIWTGHAQLRLHKANLPVIVGLDVLHNFENYSALVTNRDEKTGAVISASLGQLNNTGNWLIAYDYAHIETFSVNASFAQDDWIRWGSATQTDSSDLKGHEFRTAYALSRNINVVARLYLVDAITSMQDGKRFRLDMNFKL